MLTLKPYKDVLKMAKEQVDALLVPVRRELTLMGFWLAAA